MRIRAWLTASITAAVAAAVLAVPMTSANAADTIPAGALFIAPTGSDSNPCTQASPCKTFQKALTSGKTFVARGGTYAKDEAFTPTAGSVLQNYPGERPLHTGKFWLGSASNWRLDGLAFTWGGALTASDHMVKVTGGSGWRITNSEIYGAKSWANLLIAGSPNTWRVDHTKIHDNYGSTAHNGVQDHNVYINAATSSTATGSFDHNLVYNAHLGENVKADGTGGTSGGGMGIDIAYNTFGDARRAVLTGGTSQRNKFHHNLFRGDSSVSPDAWDDATLYIYEPLAGFANNTWSSNLVWPSPGKYVGSSAGLTRSADVAIDPQLDANWVPQNSAVVGVYGHTHGGTTTPPPAPSAPAAPASLTGCLTGTGGDQVRLDWPDVAGATSYEVWETNGTPSAPVATVTVSTRTSGALGNTSYHYFVKAKNANGTSGPSPAYDVTIPGGNAC